MTEFQKLQVRAEQWRAGATARDARETAEWAYDEYTRARVSYLQEMSARRYVGARRLMGIE